MGDAFIWWVVLELLGLAALPISVLVFKSLPDRGYSVSKVLGILLTGWLAYTLSMMQLASFTRGLLIFAVVAVVAFSIWLLLRNKRAFLNRLRSVFADQGMRRYILAAEVLFTLTFIFWTVMRAYSPDIFGTEKFMDFGFMNAIVKSEQFPPNDMWLAGYPINYYYFGFVLMAGLSLISGVPTEIAYNLANSTIPALLALGTFGLLYNLIRASKSPESSAPEPDRFSSTGSELPRRRMRPTVVRSQTALPVRPAERAEKIVIRPSGQTAVAAGTKVEAPIAVAAIDNGHADDALPVHQAATRVGLYEVVEPEQAGVRRSSLLTPILFGVLAALMVVAMGHLTTLFAVKQGGNTLEANGWRYCFACQTPQNFDWWGPSRVIKDYKTIQLPGQAPSKQASGVDAINEFPAFSFVLADLHPHVMALALWPLALSLALSFALRRVRRRGSWSDGLPRGLAAWVRTVVAGIAIGALYTTNTWDYPTFLLIALAAFLLPHFAFRRADPEGSSLSWLRPVVVEAAIIIALSFLTFLLFHLTFKSLVGSQAANIPDPWANIPVIGWLLQKAGSVLLVNTWDKGITGFLVIFGIFLVGIVGWLIYECVASYRRRGVRASSRIFFIGAGASLLSLLLAVALRFPMLALGVPIITISALLIWHKPELVVRNLVLFILAFATLIAVAIEVVYLRDVFNDRQNTIFKFYYQIWVLYAVVASYGVWRVLDAVWRRQEAGSATRRVEEQRDRPARALSSVWAGIFLLLVASGLVYGIYGPWKRAIENGIGGVPQLWGLDGTAHLARSAPGDYQAIKWLKANATGQDRVLECCRDEYNVPGHAGRVSAYTGIPTLISWAGHEAQWRGGQRDLLDEAGVRRQVVNDLYTARGGTMGAQEMLSILQQYRVNYVFVGATERGEGNAAGAYPEERVTPQAEALYKQILTPVFTSGSTVIYKVPQPAGTGGTVRLP